MPDETNNQDQEAVQKRLEELFKAIHAAAHAVQAGSKLFTQYEHQGNEPSWSLRTGLNLSKSDHAGLVQLLIDKGVFTMEEYLTAIRDSTIREKERMEQMLERMGMKVSLV